MPAARVGRLSPLPDAVGARLPDVAQLAEPFEVRLSGYLGARVANSEKNRLLQVDEDDLLNAFEHHESSGQGWSGEHAGKYLHAATLAWVYTGDRALKAKLDRVAARLLRAQEADGYLGTYTSDKRWGGWDVWAHKYDLLGLLTYYRYTGDQAAIDACRRIGNLLIATFPAKKSIIQAGEHMGMAATSVLEPIVLLYRATGEGKYLSFARYIVRSWDEPGGPRLIQALLTQRDVHKTANGKAYEMMSNLVGLCELARATGDRSLLAPVENAWRDIVHNQLYITGTTSHHEHFGEPHDLPNASGSNVGETCVTVTWIQLNMQLLRLMGEARYADELERSFYNHLAGAQQPDGARWCYYTPLEGTKPYGNSTNCCLSSGPRGMAMLPQTAYLKYLQGGREGLAVNLFETGRASMMLGGQSVSIEQSSDFPGAGRSTLTLRLKRPATFGLRVRTPQWARPLALRVGSRMQSGAPEGWTIIAPRRWKDGDKVEVTFNLSARAILGEHSNAGREALLWGPLVLAYDESRNKGGASFNSIALASKETKNPPLWRQWPVFKGLAMMVSVAAPPVFSTQVLSARDGKARPAILIPFSQASATGGRFGVWLRTPESLQQNPSLLAAGQPSFSRQGNVVGDISDGDASTYTVTYNSSKPALDWFGITLEAPATIGRVTFAHGHAFHDGGWFDASGSKPQVQVQRDKGGIWETVGTLDDYPATSAASSASLKDGQLFALRLPHPQSVVAVRVVGRPASGDDPSQAFASCGELQAFAD